MEDEFNSNEGELPDWLKSSHQISSKDAKSRYPRSPYGEGIREFQAPSEMDMVKDWAKEMAQREHSISNIRSNDDDPPDILIKMDGNCVGVEVTVLVRPKSAEEAVVVYNDRDGKIEPLTVEQANRRFPGKDHSHFAREGNPWALEDFQEFVRQIVVGKDKKGRRKIEEREARDGKGALDRHLNQQFLLIFTNETYLQYRLEEYVSKTPLPDSTIFDRIFVMGYDSPECLDRRSVYELPLKSGGRVEG